MFDSIATKNRLRGSFCLLLCLLEDNSFAQLCAVFLEFDLARDKFLVLAGPIDLAGFLVL